MESSRSRATAVVSAGLWATAPLLAIAWLHRLGTSSWLRVDLRDPVGWLQRTTVEAGIAALARYLALLASYWLAASTLSYLIAVLAGARRLLRAAGVLAFPAARRAADRLVASTIALTTIGTPLVAHTLQATTPTRSVPVPAEWVPEPYREPIRADHPDPSETMEKRQRLDGTLQRSAPFGETTVVVHRGDHMWALAERRISELLGRPASAHEIAPYWVRVVEMNRERIRSGDPDLIYPGETLVLPDVGPFMPEGS